MSNSTNDVIKAGVDVRKVKSVVLSCITFEQLETTREWFVRITKDIPKTEYNRALLLPVVLAADWKEKQLERG